MVTEEEPLVAGVNDHRVVLEAVGINPVEQLTHAVIHALNAAQIVLQVAVVLPTIEVVASQDALLAVLADGHFFGHLPHPPLPLLPDQTFGRNHLEVVPRQVLEHRLVVLLEAIGSTLVGVAKGRRLGKLSAGKLTAVLLRGRPLAVRGLMMAHQEEGLVLGPVPQQSHGQLRDDLRDVTLVDAVTSPVIEDRIVVAPLPREDVPVIETLRV